jgi:hypothetical protein
MQIKGHGSKSPVGGSRLPTSGALLRSHLLSFADAAAVQTGAAQKCGPLLGPLYEAPRSALQNAARLGDFAVQQAAPCGPLLMTDPGDLIARALAILAEEEEAWQARRGFDLPSRSVR